MAGSPIKRARKKARRLAEAKTSEAPATSEPVSSLPPAPSPALEGEILPPAQDDVEVTRTALKRAMRRAAEEHAARAMEVLAAAMEDPDRRISVPAAKEILDRAVGKPGLDMEGVKGGAVSVAIVRFGEEGNE